MSRRTKIRVAVIVLVAILAGGYVLMGGLRSVDNSTLPPPPPPASDS